MDIKLYYNSSDNRCIKKELLNELYQFNIDNPEKAVKLSEGGKIAYKEYIGKFKKQKH